MALELLIGLAWYVGSRHAEPITSKGDTAMMGSDALTTGAISVESLPVGYGDASGRSATPGRPLPDLHQRPEK